jgi:hypothetical protein
MPGSAKREAAQARLAQYERELAFEVRKGSKEGRRTERLVRESVRTEDIRDDVHRRVTEQRLGELRAVGTHGGIEASSPNTEAGSFVSPFVLVAQ